MSAAETSRPGEARTEREIAQALRLRSDPPRVMRLSRKVLIGLGVVAGLGVGLELRSNNESDIARAIRESGQDTVGRTGEEIVRRQLSVQPTLTVRPGFPVRVIVNRDLILEPYRSRPMSKLKLGPIPDDKPVKIALELPAALHRDLVAYAEALSRQSGQPVDPARLIAPVLEHFMRNDRGSRRGAAKPKTGL
jgi:hypothetical protein